MDHIIKKQAVDFREKIGLKRFELLKYHEILEKSNVVTVFLPGGIESSISGMAIKTENYRFMMVNSDHSVGRQNFTICHELYHLFIQDDFHSETSKTASFDKKDKVEYAADLFAMYLMLPEDKIYAEIDEEEFEQKNISLDTIFRLEKMFQCSHQALLYRLLNLGILSKDKYQEMKSIDIIKKADELGYDSSLYKKKNEKLILGDYEKLAKNAFDEEKISESHYISYLQDIFIEV